MMSQFVDGLMMNNRNISVIGLGYVGLPVAVAFGGQKPVIGFDINTRRIAELKNGRDSTREVSEDELRTARIRFTSNPDDLREADFHIVCVPTPIDRARRPDLTFLIHASGTLGRVLKRGDVVVYESTVYPGATEEDCVPILEQESGLKYGMDFTIGYAPERINPGDKEHRFQTINKIVSGSDEETLDLVAEVYGSVVKAGIHKAPSIRVAEAAKVIENTQRDLNIALMNELAVLFDRMGIDTVSVLEAAATKWNFLPFCPGLVGGHCIGVDPYYLTHKAQQLGYNPEVILAGRRINDSMGQFIAQRAIRELCNAGHSIHRAVVTVFGLTFKENCPDLRNTRVIDIVKELQGYGCEVQVHDPLASPEEALAEYSIQVIEDLHGLKSAHAVVVAVAHEEYRAMSVDQWRDLLCESGVFLDVKNCVPRIALERAGYRVWRL